MKRRLKRLIEGKAVLFASIGPLMGAHAVFAGNTPPPHQPNFLFLITDDQRYDALGVAQGSKILRL